MQTVAVFFGLWCVTSLEISLFSLRKTQVFSVYRLVPRFNLKSLAEPFKLFVGDQLRFMFCTWPPEASLFQPLIQENKSVGIPVESSDTVISSSAEQKQRVIKSIQLELFLNYPCKSIYPAPQIRIACCQIDLPRSKSVQHIFIA